LNPFHFVGAAAAAAADATVSASTAVVAAAGCSCLLRTALDSNVLRPDKRVGASATALQHL